MKFRQNTGRTKGKVEQKKTMLITEKLRLKDILSKTEEELADFFLREGENLANYSSRSLAEATYTSPANSIARLYEEVTRDTLALLGNDMLQKAVRILRSSQNVCIYSMGTAINQAECFREKMLKIGKRVTISSNLNYQLYEAG